MPEIIKPKWGNIYIHNTNGKRCKPIYPCKTQIDGKWAEAIVYHPEGSPSEWYIRTIDEFNNMYTMEVGQ